MKRRKALTYISAATLGAVIFPHCDFSKFPNFDHVLLDKKKWKLMGELSQVILPVPEEMRAENYDPAKFTLLMMDDCHSMEDIDRFNNGFDELMELKKTDPENSLSKLELEAIKDVLTNEEDSNLKFFFDKIKSLHIQYYTGLEDYMVNQMKFEFAPGRYLGCVDV